MWGDASHLSLQSLFLVEVQFAMLVVCFAKEGVLVFKGSCQGVLLEGLILLCNFHSSLAISNCLGVAGEKEGAGQPEITTSRKEDGIEVGDSCRSFA